jgi:hypothetical protein
LISEEYPFFPFKIVIISADYTMLAGAALPIATPNYTTAPVSANCKIYIKKGA